MQKNTNKTKPTEKTIATRKRRAVPDVYGYKPNHQNTKEDRLVHRGRKKGRKEGRKEGSISTGSTNITRFTIGTLWSQQYTTS